MKKVTMRRMGALVILCMLVLCFAPAALASETALGPMITVECAADGEPIVGMTVRLYAVGTLTQKGDVALSGDFVALPVKVAALDSSEAETLAAYVARDGIEPLCEGETSAFGSILFDQGLQEGVYLVTSDRCKTEHGWYTADPFFVTLPYKTAEGALSEQVIASPKVGTVEKVTALEVIKVWIDEGRESQRPESITVQLLADGGLYGEVALDAVQGWKHTWHDLPEGPVWQVVEKDLDEDYTVLIEKQQAQFVLKNTLKPQKEEPQPNLPQTGLTWWPVPLMIVAGLACLMIGWARRKQHGA